MSKIPKIVHYCWFGGKPLPKSALKCIESWRKFLPGFEIKEWNESNFDVEEIPYIKEAYRARKFAFVSDYARFAILHKHGGLYFDTDVEVVKALDDILEQGAFMGCEIDGGNDSILVNPGVGIGAEAGMPLYEEIIAHYRESHFINDDGSENLTTVVTRTTDILKKHGLQDCMGIQRLPEVTIYPKDFFNPLNANTGQILRTENTRSIHWYSRTWAKPSEKFISFFTRPLHRLFGEDCLGWLKRLLRR